MQRPAWHRHASAFATPAAPQPRRPSTRHTLPCITFLPQALCHIPVRLYDRDLGAKTRKNRTPFLRFFPSFTQHSLRAASPLPSPSTPPCDSSQHHSTCRGAPQVRAAPQNACGFLSSVAPAGARAVDSIMAVVKEHERARPNPNPHRGTGTSPPKAATQYNTSAIPYPLSESQMTSWVNAELLWPAEHPFRPGVC